MAIKDSKGGISWNEWEDALKNREEMHLKMQEMNWQKRLHFINSSNMNLINSGHSFMPMQMQGIQIVGDIPIYVAFDGADTWGSQSYSSLMN